MHSYSKSILQSFSIKTFSIDLFYKDLFLDTGSILDAASSRKARTTYPTRMRLAAAMAEMAAGVVEPTQGDGMSTSGHAQGPGQWTGRVETTHLARDD